MARDYDSVIIGAGHNGLVCGAYLAKAGLKVCVLERRSVLGGAAATEELWPGFKISPAAFVMSLMQPRIVDDLELKKFGLAIIRPAPLYQPMPDGSHIAFFDDLQRTCAEIARFSKKDAAAYPSYRAHMQRLARFCAACFGRFRSISARESLETSARPWVSSGAFGGSAPVSTMFTIF